MGSRDRKDRAGHKQRGKGEPTPEHQPGHVNGSRTQASRPSPRETRTGLPPSLFVGFATSLHPQPGEHPQIAHKLLDLTFGLEGGLMVTMRLPAKAWPDLRGEINAAYELATAGATQDSGLVLGGDVKAEAAAAEARADAERKARGDS